ncbi:MAG: NifB/NifX family molybdenum-iron cluster-binding protein [Spirochaetales bacterium]|nr:NifB/NifX family molybdenum-iron cluster-binding protein [Candidatus Physcosoma equi]
MRIAVTYQEDGTVFQHFGKCQSFKLYDVEEEEILSSEVISTGGERGHVVLAELLSQHDVDALICNGLGPEAMVALARRNIEVLPGVEGNADKAVRAYLDGNLEQNGDGITCDCGGDGSHSCDGNCGHCNPFGDIFQ